MKNLIVNGEIYEAEKIVKTQNSIIGYIEDKAIFAFRGIHDFSQFQLEEGQTWDIDDKATELAYLLDLDYRLSMLELGV
jgi:3-dehydroquinate dehydratase